MARTLGRCLAPGHQGHLLLSLSLRSYEQERLPAVVTLGGLTILISPLNVLPTFFEPVPHVNGPPLNYLAWVPSPLSITVDHITLKLQCL